MASLLAYTAAALVGKEIVTSAIRETATSAYTMMYTFIDHPEINNILKQLDTKATIKTVENIIKNIEIESINDTTHVVLNQVHQILCDIIDDLSKINHSLSVYKQKWFKRFRKADYSIYVDKLKLDHIILEKRLQHLFKVLSINKYLQNNKLKAKSKEYMINYIDNK
tara:strand:+ start:179 stop:679 length:501 start_codon:yes stop_codon:yes gene_type:complete